MPPALRCAWLRYEPAGCCLTTLQPPPYFAGMATPAPGQGSLTVWMDRRGMRRALSTPARNDLRVLWAAAHEVVACKSGECRHGMECVGALGVE